MLPCIGGRKEYELIFLKVIVTFNLILLKHFASGLGPIDIGFLLGVGLENSAYSSPDGFFFFRQVSFSPGP